MRGPPPLWARALRGRRSWDDALAKIQTMPHHWRPQPAWLQFYFSSASRRPREPARILSSLIPFPRRRSARPSPPGPHRCPSPSLPVDPGVPIYSHHPCSADLVCTCGTKLLLHLPSLNTISSSVARFRSTQRLGTMWQCSFSSLDVPPWSTSCSPIHAARRWHRPTRMPLGARAVMACPISTHRLPSTRTHSPSHRPSIASV